MTVYHIPFSEPLLDTLAKKLLWHYQDNTKELAHCLILLPNKRLIQSLRNAFLQNTNSSALILPKMVSIADLDYIITSIDILPILQQNPIFNDIFKQVISINKRTFILSTIIQKKDPSINITQAIAMAKSLGQIIDDAYLEHVDFANIDNIVTDQFAEHWQSILQFLGIVTSFWPSYLAENKLIDANYRKKLTYKLQQEIWQQHVPQYPILAINITSNYPDVLALLNTIKNSPKGALYFYGIDFQEDEESYNNLPFIHPQKPLATTLQALHIKREDIQQINSNNNIDSIIHKLFHKNLYKDLPLSAIETFANKLTIIETKNEEEEARSIALLLRETLDTPKKTAGLISNNNNLIQRVINELNKWDIISNDYLGTPLKDSLHAKFFLLAANVLKDNFEANSLLALLHHPFCTIKQKRSAIVKKTKLLDFYILRQFFYSGGLKQYLDTIKNLRNSNLQVTLKGLLNDISTEFQPFFQLQSLHYNKVNFNELLAVHIKIAENLTFETNTNQSTLWTHREGKELSLLLTNLLEDSKNFTAVSLSEYLGIIESMINDVNIHTIYNKHPRIHIYGQMQSNLVHHDLLIISNMNEGSMPSAVPVNPWGNKEIMKELGFTDKDHLIGLKSNILCQYLGNKEIVFTRSSKAKGQPTNPSRWLLKIKTMLKFYYKTDTSNISIMNKKSYIYSLAEKLYIPKQFTPLPNLIPSYLVTHEVLPSKISATNLEKLIKNPYLFFVSQVFKLKPLNPVASNTEHLEIGTKVHKVLETYFQKIQQYKLLPLKEQQEKIAFITEKEFRDWQNNVMFSIFKLPIIKHGIKNLLEQQYEHIQKIQTSYLELEGSIPITTSTTNLTITGRADRIDLSANNAYIYDYKTSSIAKIEDYQRQLLILAYILKQKGFASIDSNHIDKIHTNYIFLPKQTNNAIELRNNQIPNLTSYLPTFHEELTELLNKYYSKNPIPFCFNISDKENTITNEEKHFIRIEELNIINQKENTSGNNE